MGLEKGKRAGNHNVQDLRRRNPGGECLSYNQKSERLARLMAKEGGTRTGGRKAGGKDRPTTKKGESSTVNLRDNCLGVKRKGERAEAGREGHFRRKPDWGWGGDSRAG